MITQERLKEMFDYREDGNFVRKKTGVVVACNPTPKHRYLRLSVIGKPQALHRMIFLYHHGYLPKVTDHIDGNRLNNRIENLRACTQSENCLNSKHRATSTSPYKNVYLAKHSKNNPKYSPDWKENWVVSITVNKKRQYVGSFEDVELADLVATEARDLYHGAFARHS
jgi:hypothetical protein